jgi:hypothetical protein
MKFRNLLASVLAATVATASAGSLTPPESSLTGEEIEIRQDKMQSGYGAETRELTMTLVNAQGEQSQRKLRFEGFEGADQRDRTILRFNYPADVKGTALLTHEQGAGDDDQWLFLPAVQRVKRIASSNQSGSFVGSEFAYEDLVVGQLDKYTYRYVGDETIDGQACYVIEYVPKNKKSGYSKLTRWRIKDNLQELRTDFYDRKGELLKQRFIEGHRQVNGFWRVGKVTVKNVQTNKSSVLAFDQINIKVVLPESRFNVQEFMAAQ